MVLVISDVISHRLKVSENESELSQMMKKSVLMQKMLL